MEQEEYYKEILVPHLAETFLKFKDFLSIEVKYNGTILPQKWKSKNKPYFETPKPLVYPVVDKRGNPKSNTNKKWEQKVNIKHENREVKGFFIIMEKGSYSQPGVRLFRNKRVIQGTVINPNQPQTLVGTKNKFASQRLYGELHLNDFDIDFMKTKFIDNLDPLYLLLKKELQKENFNFIDQVNYYRAKKVKKQHETSEDPRTNQTDSEAKEKPNIAIKKTDEETIRKKKSSNKTTKIEKSEKIESALNNLKWKKLFHLYNSLCTISLVEHPYLAYIGSWAFFEGLSTYMKKKEKTSFDSFLSSKINDLYKHTNDRSRKKTLQKVIEDIASKGNISKHDLHEYSEAKQLNKDFKTLEDFIVQCINGIQDK